MQRLIISLMVLVLAMGAQGAPLDEAKKLFKKGLYEQALPKFQALYKQSPRSGNVNYFLGATLVKLGREDEAMKYLEVGLERDVPEAARVLAELAAADYRPDEALEYYEMYDELLRENEREDDYSEALSYTVMLQNMLSRVEKIAVIDSLVVDAEDFFRTYRLAPEAGNLVSGRTLGMADIEMAFIPQNRRQILYSQVDSLGNYKLMSADILDDGTMDHPAELPGENLGGGGNAEYPFMLSDGVTLYFASDGEGSLGGYDIFMTHRGDDGYLLPQNIGMPYNSPDDDFMLAIDETTGVGWWATDRNHIPGMLTIYIFVPSETRVNVSPDDPNLREIALLKDISLTTGGQDYSDVLEKIDAIETEFGHIAKLGGKTFEIAIGSADVVYTTLADFKSQNARTAMARAVDKLVRINAIEAELDGLRQSYSKGSHSKDLKILGLEQELDELRAEYKELVNQAISSELNNK